MKKLLFALVFGALLVSLSLPLLFPKIANAWDVQPPSCSQAVIDRFNVVNEVKSHSTNPYNVTSNTSFLIYLDTAFRYVFNMPTANADTTYKMAFATISGTNGFLPVTSTSGSGTTNYYNYMWSYDTFTPQTVSSAGGLKSSSISCFIARNGVIDRSVSPYALDYTSIPEYNWSPSPSPEPTPDNVVVDLPPRMSAGTKIGIVITFALGLYVIWLLRFRKV